MKNSQAEALVFSVKDAPAILELAWNVSDLVEIMYVELEASYDETTVRALLCFFLVSPWHQHATMN